MKSKQIIIMVMLIVAALFVASLTPLAKVRDISINGVVDNNHGIAKMLSDKNFFWTSSTQMEELIEQDIYYESAKVSKEFFMNLNIELVERVPFVAVKSGAYYVIIDVYGFVLSISEKPDALYEVEGFNVSSANIGERLSDDLTLLDRAVKILSMYEAHTPDFKPYIRLVNGEIVHDMEGIEVNYGDASDVEKQFNAVIYTYQEMVKNGATSGIINVSDPDKPYSEPKKK